MKKIMLAMALVAPLNAMALNVNIGYPVEASRMSLTGSTVAVVNCSDRTLKIEESTNAIFDKHLRKFKHVMCYGDANTYTLRFEWKRGDEYKLDMITKQTNRTPVDHNKLM